MFIGDALEDSDDIVGHITKKETLSLTEDAEIGPLVVDYLESPRSRWPK
jgi:hypothetical protein